jgi:hypothetical protein
MHIFVLRVNAGLFFPQSPKSARTSHKCFTLYKRSTRRFLILVGSLRVVEYTSYRGNLPGLTDTEIYIQRITLEEWSTHFLTHDFMGMTDTSKAKREYNRHNSLAILLDYVK